VSKKKEKKSPQSHAPFLVQQKGLNNSPKFANILAIIGMPTNINKISLSLEI
jgi:hypothetical protein